MLENALNHYSNKLVKLEENNEVLHDHLQNDYIKEDLLHESRKAQNLKKSLNAAEGEFSIPALDEDNRKTACDALKCYLNDLKESVSVIKWINWAVLNRFLNKLIKKYPKRRSTLK